MNKKCRLKRYIDALDFAIYETILFLDTHPNDRKAQAAFVLAQTLKFVLSKWAVQA